MPPPPEVLIVGLFPRLRTDPTFRVTSPNTWDYNCIAFAAGENHRWWWPGAIPHWYWPPGVPKAETLDAFHAAFATLGYRPGATPNLEKTYEKVALFVDQAGTPTHAARQLADGSWVSKLGPGWDIVHRLRELEGLPGAPTQYGTVASILARPKMGCGPRGWLARLSAATSKRLKP